MRTLAELEAAIDEGAIDTVVVAFCDMQGRLVGKRVHAPYFRASGVASHGIEGCTYLLTVDMAMEPMPGYVLASWDTGYGDFRLVPDPATVRPLPWLPGSAIVICDVAWADGSPVAPSPRQVLHRQVERARELGFEPMVGSELEFYLFRETYAEARAQNFRDLTPSVPYILDYHLLATSYDEPLLGRLRRELAAAGLEVESSKGEAWPGQHELNFVCRDALGMADDHALYKLGAKEIAAQEGYAITFMAKPSHDWIGSSCHVHSSLWHGGMNAFAADRALFEHYLAGQIAHLAELAVFVAPSVNSYKRFAAGSWAPTSLAWGEDNRTCGFRIVGHGGALRTETRIPGADANPYLAFAAVIAAGLAGIEAELELPPPVEGNAYESDVERFPASLYEAIEGLERGTMARPAFGDEVVDHYLNYARREQELFDRVVTDYERQRMYERG